LGLLASLNVTLQHRHTIYAYTEGVSGPSLWALVCICVVVVIVVVVVINDDDDSVVNRSKMLRTSTS